MELQGMDRGGDSSWVAAQGSDWLESPIKQGVAGSRRSFPIYAGQCLAADMCGDGSVVRFLDIRAVGSEGCGCSRRSLAWRMDKQGHPHPGLDGSEEEPMSSAPPSDDEFPIQDDETLSELVRTPSRTSGDLQQHA